MNGKRWCALLMALACTIGCAGLTVLPEKAETVQTKSREPLPEGYQVYAENTRFTLAVDGTEGFLRLEDRQSCTWNSTPDGHEEDPLAQGSTKLAMESLLQIKYVDRLGNINSLNGKTASVKKDGLTCERITDGVILTFEFPREGFSIPLEIVLGDNYVDISLLASRITETNDAYKLTTISILPYFGAAGSEAEGYILVPDGSGALIELNRADRYMDDYSQYVYRREYSTTKVQLDRMEQPVTMPVFGLKDGDNAMLGIITDGAGRAIVNASVNGKRCSYNNVYADFIYRDSDMVRIEKKGQTVRVMEQDPPRPERYRVRYFFFSGKEANYVDMAHTYGKWLFSQSQVRPVTDVVPLYLDLPCGVMAQENFLGFPVNRVVPLTTYADVQTIIDRLRELGVTDTVVNLRYWNKDGTGAAIPTSVEAEGRLGGKKGLTKLLQTYADSSTALYLDFNFTDMVKSRWGYHTGVDSATSIQKSPALQFEYKLNDQKALMTQPTFLLNFRKIQQASSKVIASLKKYPSTGVSANTLGQKLYSDFSGKTVKRDTADKEWQTVLERLRTAAGRQLLSAPNAYAIPYADIVTDTPLNNSGFLTETCAVPFYQIALHEYVPMSTPDINRMSDVRQGVLGALESGIGLKFQFIMRGSERLTETSYHIIGSLFEDWDENASALYREVSAILNKTAGQRILSHRLVTPDVRETVFANGVHVWVNYGDTVYTGMDCTVEPGGYTVQGM